MGFNLEKFAFKVFASVMCHHISSSYIILCPNPLNLSSNPRKTQNNV